MIAQSALQDENHEGEGIVVHTPVLLEEVLRIFNPTSGQVYIDATVNGGGHARAIARRVGKEGSVLGIDWDCDLINHLQTTIAKEGFGEYLIPTCGNYREMKEFARREGIARADGILFDLGWSSHQIEDPSRGFSFRRDGPLDMRYNKNHEITAEQIINTWPGEAIEDIFRRYGEERHARRIARRIIAERARAKIRTTVELRQLVHRVLGSYVRRSRIDPATRVFQALRIAVNQELEHLAEGLAAAYELLKPQGILIAISFHSLEDRIIKHTFRENVRVYGAHLITKKPIRPTYEEYRMNPRARSAKLRALQKIV